MNLRNWKLLIGDSLSGTDDSKMSEISGDYSRHVKILYWCHLNILAKGRATLSCAAHKCLTQAFCSHSTQELVCGGGVPYAAYSTREGLARESAGALN